MANVTNGLQVEIGDQRLEIRTEVEPDFVQEVVAFVNRRLDEVSRRHPGHSNLNVALLACMNVAGELIRTRRKEEQKKESLKKKIRSLIQAVDLGKFPLSCA